MERYHIFKLGWAITFYAAYCARPMLVYSLDGDNNVGNNKNIVNAEYDYFQYFQGVDGIPGRDYPIYSYIPKTAFNCRGIESGYYADLETDCQIFHICEEGKKISFLCPNGTIFQQSELICEWWNKVNCTNSPNLYEESAERLQNEVARRKSSRRITAPNAAEMNHGAIMRLEERTSVRVNKNGKEYPVRQQIIRSQRLKNHNIPDNNDIEQQIEEAESNNRHLANAQTIAPVSQKNNRKYSNHNYNAAPDTDSIDNIDISRAKQIKKDIDKETGNFLNQNYDTTSTRQSKKVDQSEKNNYNFGIKTTKQKGSSLKEYHVEFGSTSAGVDSSTTSYSLTEGRPHFSSITRNLENNDDTSSFLIDLSENTDSPILSTPTGALEPSPKTSDLNYNTPDVNNKFDGKISNINRFSTTTFAPKQQNGKINRGSARYNTNLNYFNTQQPQNDYSKNKFTSQPVTTYSPPTKYFSSTISQNSHLSSQNNRNQDDYDLPFPKHKSEVSSDHSDTEIKSEQKNTELPSQSSPVVPKQLDISVIATENQRNQESDETQVPQESSSFVKNSFNTITDNSLKTSSSPYPNHRSTYSDIKDISYLEAPKAQSISSITAHLVTTQPINKGKPFVGSRVGTTLLPNQQTTLSKYTYLPTTSTDRYKPAVIFGVIRHISTTEPAPYGPPELFNLGNTTQSPISDSLNLGNTDKTLPTVETTTSITNPVPAENFNIGNTESTLKPNVVSSYGTTTITPLNILVPEHGSLNVGSGGEASQSQNKQELQFTNKNPTAFRSGDTDGTSIAHSFSFNSINKINPDLGTSVPVTTENLNVGAYGSTIREGGETNNFKSVEPHLDRFNTGNNERTLPTIETTTFVTNSVPTETFNTGNTDSTVKPNVVPSLGTSTIKPLEIYVPEHGSLNLGQKVINSYNDLVPVSEPPFIKKSVPLLYSNQSRSVSTVRTVDHATVYGTYASPTQRSLASSSNTLYSPTVPTVTQSPPIYKSTTSSRTPKAFSQGIPIRFANGQDKISVQLSKNVGGQTQISDQLKYKSILQPSVQRVNAVVRVGDIQQLESSSIIPATHNQPSGFHETENFSKRIPNSYSTPVKSKTERPRPFARTLDIEERFNTGSTNTGPNTTGSTFPAYQISSARPFGISQTTASTPFIATQTTPTFGVYDNVDSMMNVLQEIVNYNSQNDYSENSRPGLVVPPSVGPDTLHSLAQYFANELQNNDPEKKVLRPETKEKLTSLLTAMTVHGYNKLFNVETTAAPTDSTTDDLGVSSTGVPSVSKESERGNGINVENRNSGKDNSTSSGDDLLTTTSLPELRQLARNFSIALSSYLHDPDNFRKSLEGLRPTEPPPLDGSDNIESSTTEDELLNFSDADAKPSTPIIPSATWGYIVAADSKKPIVDDVKNSLNPDLNTADSQSFIPRFNNLQVDEKQQKGFTDLPPNHWTSSPKATKLWQKALTINPAAVNEHLETTPSLIASDEDETTEAELFNQEVLPDHSGEPHSEISYDLRELPPISLNSTQVHGILIDFMNHTKSDEYNRLSRILKKLNTSEEEFLRRMKEIESNPLTKRLVLLLISECGANITQDLGLTQYSSRQRSTSQNEETLSALASTASFTARNAEPGNKEENHSLGQLVHSKLREEDQDTRALQLLNSLYTIASKFGRKR